MSEEKKALEAAVESAKIEGKNFEHEDILKLMDAIQKNPSAGSFLYELVKEVERREKESQRNGNRKR